MALFDCQSIASKRVNLKSVVFCNEQKRKVWSKSKPDRKARSLESTPHYVIARYVVHAVFRERTRQGYRPWKESGICTAIGGPNGLAMGLAMGDFHFETILGSSYFSGNSSSCHSHLRRLRLPLPSAKSATRCLFVGGRSIWVPPSVDLNGGRWSTNRGATSDIVQWGVDIPLRIYWFPQNLFHCILNLVSQSLVPMETYFLDR